MIDERTKLMIETYLPHPPDPDLPEGAYYWLQYTAGATGKPRVLTVYIRDIMPTKYGTEYGIYQIHGGNYRRVATFSANPMGGVRKYDLYDNKQDCRDQTHMAINNWETLRKIQKDEGLL